MAKVKGAFRGWVAPVNFGKSTPVPRSFVLQLPDELTPAYIADRFCQGVVLDHVLDGQTLDTYDLVLAYDVDREFVLIVSSSISNPSMDTSNLATGFLTVLRPFLLLGLTALCPCQLLFIFGKECGIAMGLSIRGDDHRLETQVKPDHLGGDFQRLDGFFYQHGDEIPV